MKAKLVNENTGKNHIKLIDSLWFTEMGSNKPIGIVKVFDEITKKYQYFIGTGYGDNEDEDAQKIKETGSKFPFNTGNCLFGE